MERCCLTCIHFNRKDLRGKLNSKGTEFCLLLSIQLRAIHNWIFNKDYCSRYKIVGEKQLKDLK